MSFIQHDAAATRSLAEQLKYAAFNDWLKENGAIFDKVQYPAVFANKGAQPTTESGPNPPTMGDAYDGIVGSIAKADIAPNDVICAIPVKMVLCPSRAKKDAQLAEILNSHADLFEANTLREFFILTVFVMHERAKGKDSFWHPYFEVVQLIDQPATWPDE